MKHFEYHHVVSFEDTNFVGNVYFSKYLSWQGRCRELFLEQHVPSMLSELRRGAALVTLRCSCDYLDQLHPFDQVLVVMTLAGVQQNRVAMAFEYWRVAPGERTLVARGEHEIAYMRRERGNLYPSVLPRELRDLLERAGVRARTSRRPREVLARPAEDGANART